MLNTIFIILSIIILIYHTFGKQCVEFFTMVNVKSTVDGGIYPVIASYKDKEEAANLIGSMNAFTIKLISLLKKTYIDTPHPEQYTHIENSKEKIVSNAFSTYVKGRELTQALLSKFNSKSLQENEPNSIDKTSYTTNKGEVISLCLREKLSGKNEFHDLDVLKFVLIHELSHIVTPELQHTVVFWTNFRFLLDFCNKNEIYTVKDYSKDNVNYCGLMITYIPTNDDSLTSYFS